MFDENAGNVGGGESVYLNITIVWKVAEFCGKRATRRVLEGGWAQWDRTWEESSLLGLFGAEDQIIEDSRSSCERFGMAALTSSADLHQT